MMKPLIFLTVFVALFSVKVYAGADDILGIWRNPTGNGHVEIFKENGKYYGKLVWLKKTLDKDGKPFLDKNNPDKQRCDKPLLGVIMLRDFLFEDGEWKGGKAYNPDDGKEYRSFIKLKDDKTLSVRGFIGFSWIGKTLNFQRVR